MKGETPVLFLSDQNPFLSAGRRRPIRFYLFYFKCQILNAIKKSKTKVQLMHSTIKLNATLSIEELRRCFESKTFSRTVIEGQKNCLLF